MGKIVHLFDPGNASLEKIPAFERAITDVDNYCQHHYPYVAPRGLDFFFALFNSRFRHRIVTDFNRESTELPILYVASLENRGKLLALARCGRSFNDVIKELRQRDAYQDKCCSAKLDYMLQAYEELPHWRNLLGLCSRA